MKFIYRLSTKFKKGYLWDKKEELSTKYVDNLYIVVDNSFMLDIEYKFKCVQLGEKNIVTILGINKKNIK